MIFTEEDAVHLSWKFFTFGKILPDKRIGIHEKWMIR